jgi:hypothetical protein
MAIVGTVIGVLAFIATACDVYYARGQLREAQKNRVQNQLFIENRIRENDLWSEKNVRASELLCKIASRFVQGGPGRPSGDALSLLFPDYSVRNRILTRTPAETFTTLRGALEEVRPSTKFRSVWNTQSR